MVVFGDNFDILFNCKLLIDVVIVVDEGNKLNLVSIIIVFWLNVDENYCNGIFFSYYVLGFLDERIEIFFIDLKF